MGKNQFYMNSILTVRDTVLHIEQEGRNARVTLWDPAAFRPYPSYELDKNTPYPSYVKWDGTKPIEISTYRGEDIITLKNIRT